MSNMQFGQIPMQQPIMNPYMTNQNSYPYMNRYNTGYSQPQNNGITWVQGIEGAKAYQLAPNSNVLLMDSDNDGIFYIKVSDNVGMCNLRTFNYVETTNNPPTTVVPQIDMSEYVTKNELNEILKGLKGGKSNGKQAVSANESKPLITE